MWGDVCHSWICGCVFDSVGFLISDDFRSLNLKSDLYPSSNRLIDLMTRLSTGFVNYSLATMVRLLSQSEPLGRRLGSARIGSDRLPSESDPTVYSASIQPRSNPFILLPLGRSNRISDPTRVIAFPTREEGGVDGGERETCFTAKEGKKWMFTRKHDHVDLSNCREIPRVPVYSVFSTSKFPNSLPLSFSLI